MESGYRTWLRERREGVAPQYLDELRGELQMALGTAKWQVRFFCLIYICVCVCIDVTCEMTFSLR